MKVISPIMVLQIQKWYNTTETCLALSSQISYAALTQQ